MALPTCNLSSEKAETGKFLELTGIFSKFQDRERPCWRKESLRLESEVLGT